MFTITVLAAPGRADLGTALVEELRLRYPDFPASPDYTRIINDAQYGRLSGWLDEARAKGATVVAPFADALDPQRARRERLFAPVLVLDPPEDCALMQQEIFGPILPVLGYRTLDEALARIDALDRHVTERPPPRNARGE